MQIESLRYFVELAETGSFARAAKSSFITKQGLNKAVTTLERELDVRLVERTRTGVELTPSGELFYEKARPVLAAYDELLDSMLAREARQGTGRRLVAHVTYYSAQIATASFGYVRILRSLSYIEEPFSKIVERARVEEGDELNFVEVNGRSLEKMTEDGTLAFMPMLSTRVGLVLPEASPLSQERSLRLSAIRDLPIAYNAHKEIAQLMEWIFEKDPLTDVRLGVASPRMTLEWAQANPDGGALMDSLGFYLCRKGTNVSTEGLRFVPLATERAHCQAGFVYRRRASHSVQAENAVNALHRYLNRACADYFERYPVD